MDSRTARRRLTSARIGHLATITPAGRPHVVPCCFDLAGDTVYSAVDAKPKTTLALRRLQNIRTNGDASLLVDHYQEDWASLWWVRVDGRARVVDDDAERDRAFHLLTEKYLQYRAAPPPGPVIAIAIDSWRMWP